AARRPRAAGRASPASPPFAAPVEPLLPPAAPPVASPVSLLPLVASPLTAAPLLLLSLSFEPPSAEPVLVFALASPVSEVPPEASPPSALPDSLPPLLLAARAPLVALAEASPDSGLPLFSESAFVTSAGSELALETATFFASPLSFPPDRAPEPAFAVEEPLPASPDS